VFRTLNYELYHIGEVAHKQFCALFLLSAFHNISRNLYGIFNSPQSFHKTKGCAPLILRVYGVKW